MRCDVVVWRVASPLLVSYVRYVRGGGVGAGERSGKTHNDRASCPTLRSCRCSVALWIAASSLM